jgi:hypothetical protein
MPYLAAFNGVEGTGPKETEMLDVPIEMMTTPSMSDLDFALAAGTVQGTGFGSWEGRSPEGDDPTGGGAHSLFNPDNYWKMTDSESMVQSDGYVLADYDGDGRYDQAWITEDGQWKTTNDGQTWRPDDGPMDEWEWLQRRESL